MPPLLPTQHSLHAALTSAGWDMQVKVYPTVDSTNTQARRMIEAGEITGDTPTLLLAYTQTAGRGRMGRGFHSPEGSGLYFSLAYKPHTTLNLTAVTPAAAVATANAIQSLTGRSPLIKWVNDLYLDGRKVCGILTEAVADPRDKGVFIILGIGINITTQHFPEGLRHPAGCILSSREADKDLDLSTLVAEVVRGLFACLDRPDDCLRAYKACFLLTGRTVTYAYVCSPDGEETPETVTGVVQGVDADYALLLRLPDGKTLALGSGEVTSCGE